MASRLIDPRLLGVLRKDFFNRTGTVQAPTKTQTSTGQEKKGWADVPGMIDIKCRISPAGGGERRFREQAYVDATDIAVLAGAFDGLTEQHRFVDDTDHVYDILRVEPDSEDIATRLTLRSVR